MVSRKKKKGREHASFQTLANGREVYARDRRGAEIYPETTFAKDERGEPYYARDADGHEYYPLRKKRSLPIPGGKPARYRDGTERYPTDDRGNEYYWKRDGVPYLMKDATGRPYLAKTRKGHALIPWNFLQDYVTNEPYRCSVDSDKNFVYVNEVDLSPFCKLVMRCVCNVIVLCPSAFGCVTTRIV